MGISLTLTQLKEYFKTWHDSLFDDLHKTKVTSYINEFLNDPTNNIMTKINLIDDLKTNILAVGKFILKMVDGSDRQLSSINDISTNLSNNISRLNSLNLQKLANDINTNAQNIAKKVDKSYVDSEISRISANIGVEPKLIQIQDIKSGDNLNEYKTSGIYKSINSSITQTVDNRPEDTNNRIGTAFDLIVINNKDTEINNTVTTKQLVLTSGTGTDGNRIYSRNYVASSNEWSNWIEFYGTHNLSTLQMKVEFSNNSSATYTLLQK